MCDISTADQELPAYLAKLVLRLNQGSDFWGRFFIYTGRTIRNLFGTNAQNAS